MLTKVPQDVLCGGGVGLAELLVKALPPCVELAFHACWLHHAANELQQPARSYQPFVDIVKHISINPAEWL